VAAVEGPEGPAHQPAARRPPRHPVHDHLRVDVDRGYGARIGALGLDATVRALGSRLGARLAARLLLLDGLGHVVSHDFAWDGTPLAVHPARAGPPVRLPREFPAHGDRPGGGYRAAVLH